VTIPWRAGRDVVHFRQGDFSGDCSGSVEPEGGLPDDESGLGEAEDHLGAVGAEPGGAGLLRPRVVALEPLARGTERERRRDARDGRAAEAGRRTDEQIFVGFEPG